MIKRLLFLFLTTLSLGFLSQNCNAQQQGIPSEGKDFYIGYVYPSFNKHPYIVPGYNVSGFYNVYALISSYEDKNQITIGYFDAQSGKEVPSLYKFVSARNAIEIPLDQVAMRCSDTGDIAEYRACHITSKKPVSVQYFTTGGNSGGSYLALPILALGKKYVIASYNDNPRYGALRPDSAENSGGFFEIIAAFDSTTVSIIPNGLTAGGHIGVNSGLGSDGTKRPYTVLLRRGQVYLVKGDGTNEYNDMSGSIVTGDKPFGVLAGHEDAFLGGVNGNMIDGRNYMIQQLVPVEDFESSGYVSIPFPESPNVPPTDDGYGQNFRLFAFDTTVVDIQATDTATTYSMGTFAYNHPSKEIQHIHSSAEFHSPSGKKFSVMAYDLRAIGSDAPYPSPSMMTIVPMSHWRTSYLFDVVANSFIQFQREYISLIALKTDIEKGFIKYSLNGSASPQNLTALKQVAAYVNIPNHPELKGVIFETHPGAYYFTNTRDGYKNRLTDSGFYYAPDDQIKVDTALLHGSFMLYNCGMRGLDPDRDIGNLDGDDYYFEYSSPAGMLVSNGSGYPKPKIKKIDTLCNSWHVCVSDPNGIRSVQLLDDPGGNYVRPGKQFHNAHFDAALDPEGKGEIDFTGKDTLVCFDLIVSNPLDSAYAPLYIVDAVGNHVDPIPELYYQPAHVRLSKLPDLPANIDTLIFPPLKVGDEICSTLVYINTAGATGKSIAVNSVSFLKNEGHFKIASIFPKLPAMLKPHDTLEVQVCFKPDDTLFYKDSLVIKTDCFEAPLPIVGQGGTPLIFATDIDFGDVIVGSKSRKPLTVRNTGTVPFVLGNDWFIHNQAIYSMESASAALLPATLQPGGKAITLYFDYIPLAIGTNDSSSVNWNTDIPEPYSQQLKSWSFLKGHAILPGVRWDRERQYFLLDSTFGFHTTIQRVFLFNSSGARVHVDKVFFIGQTSSEFSITQDQINFMPLRNFDMQNGDSIWVDVQFDADILKPYPDRFADRVDSIVATYFNPADPSRFDSIFIKLIGVWNKSGVNAQPELSSFTIRPNPTSGGSVILSFALLDDEKVNISIFDVLGREVFHEVRGMLSAGNHEESIALPKLETGIYYVRLTTGSTVRTEKMEIVK